jgi:hypothetical protein
MSMKNASKSSRPAHGEPEAAVDTGRARALARRRERRRWYKLLAPPDVPHRRREARRWLDELAVRTTNGRVSERRPDHRYISIAESFALCNAQHEALRAADPELHRAVERLIFENGMRDIDITIEEWKVRSARRSRRISKVRAEMQRAGLV